MKLNTLTIKEARQLLDQRKISARDLTQACLDEIKARDHEIKSCLNIFEEQALIAADQADQLIAENAASDLTGIPCLIKDNILVKGELTTAGSKILADYRASYDATVIKKLKTAGAIILGKTNLDEFAHGASTENSAFGPTHNPHDLQRSPGGSSGGSAAAVSANFCLFSLGTDTGGSIRHPASFCGVVGHKPTYGLCSRFGLIAMTSSTDVPGPITKTSEDAALVLKTIKGYDELDATSLKEDLKIKCNFDPKRITIGLPDEYFHDELNDQVKEKILEAADFYRSAGATIKSVSLPHTKYGVSVYYIITPSEISANLARFDGLRYSLSQKDMVLNEYYHQHRGEKFGRETKRRIMLGTYALSAGYYDAYYLKAQKVRTKIIEDFKNVFKEVDLLLTPATPTTAFYLGEKNKNPLEMYLEDFFLAPASLAGLPAVSWPLGKIDNLPIGGQLIGPMLADGLILSAADFYEKNYH